MGCWQERQREFYDSRTLPQWQAGGPLGLENQVDAADSWTDLVIRSRGRHQPLHLQADEDRTYFRAYRARRHGHQTLFQLEMHKSRQGRLNPSRSVSRPFGTYRAGGRWVPNAETLGYYRMSLRDKGLDRCLGYSLGANPSGIGHSCPLSTPAHARLRTKMSALHSSMVSLLEKSEMRTGASLPGLETRDEFGRGAHVQRLHYPRLVSC